MSVGITEKGDTFDPRYVCWVMDADSEEALGTAIYAASEIVIDLETTGLNEHESGLRPEWPVAARISMASLTLPQESYPNDYPMTYVLPLSHVDSPNRGRWRQVMARVAKQIRYSSRPITNQHLKFDLKWIHAHTGIDLSPQFAWDTQISSHLLDETSSTALKVRAPDTFGMERWDDYDLSTPGASERVPLFDLGLYAARDTYWTWRLARLHRYLMGVGAEGEETPEPNDSEDIEYHRLGQLAVREAMPNAAVLTAMEQRGMRLDPIWTKGTLVQQETIMDEMWGKLVPRYELDIESEPSLAPTSLWFRAWSEAAVEAGDLKIISMTRKGNAEWSKENLGKLARQGYSVAEDLLTYRRAFKRAEYLRSWLELATSEETVHPTYWPGRVVTGRLSCSDPNMQQVSKEIKPAYIPTDGYYIAELDYSQIELRVAAFIADCKPMKEAYARGEDLHRLMAAQVNQKDPSEVTALERQQGKAGNFGLLYAMSADGFRNYAEAVYGVIFTEREAQEVHDAFFKLWHGMTAWHDRCRRKVRATGQVVSPIGRVRRLPDIHSSNGYRVDHAEKSAINSPVQGFASDLMQMSAASIEGYLPGHDPVPEVRLVGTVHDSIVVEVPIEDWKRHVARCMRRMINIPDYLPKLGCHMDVPLAVEATIGTRWGLSDVGVITS